MKSTLVDWSRWLAVGLLTAATALDARAATLHVWGNSAAPTPPYDSWPTAARNIQDAVDAASFGDTVLVTNGVYSAGGHATSSYGPNRLTIQKGITVRSVNGPDVTIIQGAPAPGGGSGASGVGCVSMGVGDVLDGLTVTGGHVGGAGGGVLCVSTSGVIGETNAVITNCVITGNVANDGGGVCGGTIYSSRIVGNRAAYDGGGAWGSVLVNCQLLENVAEQLGGGMLNGSARNCVLAGNTAGTQGGGASGAAVLFNCTVTGNWAGLRGGGIDYDVLARNSIIFYNQAPIGSEYATRGTGLPSYCCTRPLPLAACRT